MQLREKTLSEILCLLSPNTLSLQEAKNRSPISVAKFLKRFLCRRRFALCLQHHAPVRGSKRRCPVLCAWGHPIPRGLILDRHIAIQAKSHAKIKSVSRCANLNQTNARRLGLKPVAMQFDFFRERFFYNF